MRFNQKMNAILRRRWKSLAALLVGALVLGAPVYPALAAKKTAAPRAVVIFRIDRIVVRKKAGKGKGADKKPRYVSARAQTTAQVGDVIRTREHSRAEIHLLGDGVFIRLKENSVLKIRKADGPGRKPADVSLRLLAGRALLKVAKTLGAGARVRVRTATAVAAVRGTVFAVEVSKPSETDIKVLEGVVAASALSGGKEGASRDVTAGREISAREGGALSEPVEIPAQELAEEKAWAEETAMEPVQEEAAGEQEEPGAEEAEPDAPEVIEPEPEAPEAPEVEEAEPAEPAEPGETDQ